jgi:peptidyl-prolyl cis-trans isomerase NIMA-interacting 1
VTVFVSFSLVALSGCDKPSESGGAPNPSTSVPTSAAQASASAAPATTASAPPHKPPHEPPTQVAAQHVLVPYKGAEKCPKGVTRSKAEAKTRAENVSKKAKEKGADFSALVAEFSEDPAAKERQGSLGKFAREKMAKPFSDAAFALEVDEISDPVETPFGFHVIKRNQ